MEWIGDTKEDLPHPASEEADAPLSSEDFVRIQEKTLDEKWGANYNGDWTSLLYERLKNPKIKEKFLSFKEKYPTAEERVSKEFEKKNEDGLTLEKPTDLPKDLYEKTIADYDENLEKVFRSTRYHYSEGTNFDGSKVEEVNTHAPKNGGVSYGYGDEGSVFVDAKTKDGVPYSPKEKNIIEAHEKAHGVFGNLTKEEKKHIWNVFEHAKIGYGYSKNPEEILIRLTQIKNYFGFKGDEEMTLNRLRYAKAHYIEDVGLDNNMSQFFEAITPEKEQAVVDLMNQYPC